MMIELVNNATLIGFYPEDGNELCMSRNTIIELNKLVAGTQFTFHIQEEDGEFYILDLYNIHDESKIEQLVHSIKTIFKNVKLHVRVDITKDGETKTKYEKTV